VKNPIAEKPTKQKSLRKEIAFSLVILPCIVVPVLLYKVEPINITI